MNKQEWIKAALAAGFDQFEIYQSGTKERSYTWFEGKMDTFTASRVLGTSLRGICGGKMVNYATEDLSDDGMDRIIASMKEQAGAITSDEPGVIRSPLPVPETAPQRRWTTPTAAEVRELLADIEQRVLAYDERIFMVIREGWSEETGTRSIFNSLGMDLEDTDTVQILTCGAAAKDGNDIKNEYRSEIVEDIHTFDRDAFVEKLCTDVLNKLNASSMASGTYPVIFESGAMTALFTAFSSMFSGDLIAKGISPLRDQYGQPVFSGKITITDDPLRREAAQVCPFDDEGCPTSAKTIVDHGVFRTILHNTRSASRINAESTGNGFRGSYASPVEVSPMNCCIEPGDKTLKELCAEMQNGLVITTLAGLHAGINPVTTDFSLQCSGYWVKDGKRDHSVSLVTVAANFLEMMGNVTAVGSDLEWKQHSVVTPSIAFKGCAISGK
ncbi:MAG: TldD/PmbA family protein [Solobacterium sp.]|nr:TldD/PmbA family protein [Solobacterium sp.]